MFTLNFTPDFSFFSDRFVYSSIYNVTKSISAIFDLAWEGVITDTKVSALGAGKAIEVGVGTSKVISTSALRAHSSHSSSNREDKWRC